MSKQIKTMEQLRDSQLLYEKKMPLFGYILVVIFSLSVLLTIVWSTVTPKPYIVQGSGVVESSDKSYVMSAHAGEILQTHMAEGMLVDEGDALLSVRCTDTAEPEAYTIAANTSGAIHLLADCTPGTVVSAGEVLGSISGTGNSYAITVGIDAADIAKINIGDPVSIEIVGLSPSVYGTLSGEVAAIDSDITMNKESSYYNVIITLDQSALTNRKTEETIRVRNGMLSEVRIIYNQESYFDYFTNMLLGS